MTGTFFVALYLAAVLYVGIFAFRRARGGDSSGAENFFLAGRSLGGFVFLFSLFGTHMTAFAILGSSGHAFHNGIVTYGLMASSSAFVVPLLLLFLGTKLWWVGREFGHMTPVQIFRDRWECGHIGTVIFVVQAVLLVPYIIIGVIGGGTAMRAISGGLVPYWLGGAIVAAVVMSYVARGEWPKHHDAIQHREIAHAHGQRSGWRRVHLHPRERAERRHVDVAEHEHRRGDLHADK